MEITIKRENSSINEADAFGLSDATPSSLDERVQEFGATHLSDEQPMAVSGNGVKRKTELLTEGKGKRSRTATTDELSPETALRELLRSIDPETARRVVGEVYPGGLGRLPPIRSKLHAPTEIWDLILHLLDPASLFCAAKTSHQLCEIGSVVLNSPNYFPVFLKALRDAADEGIDIHWPPVEDRPHEAPIEAWQRIFTVLSGEKSVTVEELATRLHREQDRAPLRTILTHYCQPLMPLSGLKGESPLHLATALGDHELIYVLGMLWNRSPMTPRHKLWCARCCTRRATEIAQLNGDDKCFAALRAASFTSFDGWDEWADRGNFRPVLLGKSQIMIEAACRLVCTHPVSREAY